MSSVGKESLLYFFFSRSCGLMLGFTLASVYIIAL